MVKSKKDFAYAKSFTIFAYHIKEPLNDTPGRNMFSLVKSDPKGSVQQNKYHTFKQHILLPVFKDHLTKTVSTPVSSSQNQSRDPYFLY